MWRAQFNPDGSRIVTESQHGTVQVWDVSTGKAVATLGRLHDSGARVQFSPDGTHILTVPASTENTVYLSNILPSTAGAAPDWFPDFLRYMAQMRLNADGELETLKWEDWLALRERMREVQRASTGEETPYLRILRRFVPQ